MDHVPLERKLAAIFHADVAGYSRLSGRDEEGTHRLLTVYFDIMTKLIGEYRGHVIKHAGDAVLAEFSSVLDALNCALEIQRELQRRNAKLPQESRLEFRIGINLGDVIVDHEDIFGDDVNVAARIEKVARPSGICISESVYAQVRHKLSVTYEDLGFRRFKNIDVPVRVYAVVPDSPPDRVQGKFLPRNLFACRFALIVAVVGSLVISGIVILLLRQPEPIYLETAQKPPEPRPDLPLWHSGMEQPGKPSIAVLPFTLLGDETTEEYFADGISNDIITDLSRFRGLFVIASNTMFTYKGKAVRVKELGRELGVRYVLEGSVQRRGDQLRISAQLIEAASGHHLWAERYDRAEKDLFSVQDDIIRMIVNTLALTIDHLEQDRALRKATESLEAHDYLMRGRAFYVRRTRSANREARRMFQRAIEIDPRYAAAYVGLGFTHMRGFWSGWTEFPDEALQQAQQLAQQALAIDPTNPQGHVLLGNAHLHRGRYQLATDELARAIELNPNDAQSFIDLGKVKLWSSQPEEAIKVFEIGFRLNPGAWVGERGELALAYYINGQYDRAISILEQNLVHRPDAYASRIHLTAAYAQSGRQQQAEQSAAELLRIQPFFRVSDFKLFRSPEHNAKVAEGLRKAGLQ